mmetsp:Transcript_25787/g.56561  ORF Transcript_25787/g.56561 Transcript_25787/m.56561 type:complete len:183 (-) Transcript_25787:340-888(-)|eukprot:CAMPEP_0168193566 /NCGR_PEP_ID=MMETSP0139_2-20121125/18679_1 /TAXON_ID=44445 /ORGANISM="Pseudo-nitzschia australis, Strain 10249 10 AB" /LENGTH=182 /DNA_ID=CAMNT_0008116939 /DNA_START=127 /DNA_END=675 /DNA_ORIENTATION=+
MLMQQQQQQLQQQEYHDTINSPIMSRSSKTILSASSWHPIQSSPSEDMWELPASASSMSMSSDDRDDFPTTPSGYGLHQEFSIYHDPDDYQYSSSTNHHEERVSMPPTVTVRTTYHQHNHHNEHRRYSSSATMSNMSDHNRNSTGGVGLSGKKCVLGDATNTVRRRNSNSNNTRRMQRNYFN